MQTLQEVKFNRTGKEYLLTKTETGFNCTLVDFDEVQPVHRTFEKMLELSKAGDIVFKGFEAEKKSEAELILLSLIHETENNKLKAENESLKIRMQALGEMNEELTSMNEELTSGNEELTAKNEKLAAELKTATELLQMVKKN